MVTYFIKNREHRTFSNKCWESRLTLHIVYGLKQIRRRKGREDPPVSSRGKEKETKTTPKSSLSADSAGRWELYSGFYITAGKAIFKEG